MAAVLERTLERETVVVAEADERQALSRIARILERPQASTVKVVSASGEEVELPASLFLVLKRAAAALERGGIVTVIPQDRELTTQEAADMLNMSRQYLIRLVEKGEIPHTKTGTHRRIRLEDLQAYRARRDAERREHLRRLTEMSQESGEYFAE
jgi:excisionase family DNA binding protein